jgi:transcriptional regulator with XRE-family HTH domain
LTKINVLYTHAMISDKTAKQISIEALEEAKAILKSKGLSLAKELMVTRGAMSQWKLGGRGIPPKHCPRIEVLTDRRVTCQRLNSKVFGVLGAEKEAVE